MKYVQWAGGIAILFGATLTAILATAAVGDVIYRVAGTEAVLTAQQKTDLSSCVTAIFPSAVPADIRTWQFQRDVDDATNPWYATGCYEETDTIDNYVALELAGTACEFISEAAGTVTFHKRAARKALTAGQRTTCAAWYHSVFPRGATATASADMVVDVQLWRDGADTVAKDFWVKTDTKANYIVDREAGIVIDPAPLGEVTE